MQIKKANGRVRFLYNNKNFASCSSSESIRISNSVIRVGKTCISIYQHDSIDIYVDDNLINTTSEINDTFNVLDEEIFTDSSSGGGGGDYDNIIDELVNVCDAMRKDVDSVSGDVDSISKDINNMSGSIDSVSKDIESLTESTSLKTKDLDSEISTLKTSVSDTNKTISSVNSDLQGVKFEVNNIVMISGQISTTVGDKVEENGYYIKTESVGPGCIEVSHNMGDHTKWIITFHHKSDNQYAYAFGTQIVSNTRFRVNHKYVSTSGSSFTPIDFYVISLR